MKVTDKFDMSIINVYYSKDLECSGIYTYLWFNLHIGTYWFEKHSTQQLVPLQKLSDLSMCNIDSSLNYFIWYTIKFIYLQLKDIEVTFKKCFVSYKL